MSNEKEPKIGAGHADAMWRQGLAELRAALYPESNIAQPPQGGQYGTKTQREVYDSKQSDVVEREHNDQGKSDRGRESLDEGRE